MKVEQFVMAYGAEQDRIRALLPEGYESLRPVLRINAEIRTGNEETAYIELNTPVAAFGKRGWLNIDRWESKTSDLSYERNGSAVTFDSPFLTITYTGVGIEGGCPAEKDNDGCFFIGETVEFVPAERIETNREYCNCEFRWKFAAGDAHGKRTDGKTLPAVAAPPQKHYEKQEFSAQTAAAIPCEQILGSYKVIFERSL